MIKSRFRVFLLGSDQDLSNSISVEAKTRPASGFAKTLVCEPV
jgi:hypothetical protein